MLIPSPLDFIICINCIINFGVTVIRNKRLTVLNFNGRLQLNNNNNKPKQTPSQLMPSEKKRVNRLVFLSFSFGQKSCENKFNKYSDCRCILLCFRFGFFLLRNGICVHPLYAQCALFSLVCEDVDWVDGVDGARKNVAVFVRSLSMDCVMCNRGPIS